MPTFQVKAPNQSVVAVQCKLGSFQFTHNDIMFNDKLASLFPSIFIKISDGVPVHQVVPEPVYNPDENLKKLLESIRNNTTAPLSQPTNEQILQDLLPNPNKEASQESSTESEILEEKQEVIEEVDSQESSTELSIHDLIEESIEGDYQEEDNSEDTPVEFVQKKRGPKSKRK